MRKSLLFAVFACALALLCSNVFAAGFIGDQKLLIPELTSAPIIDGTGSDSAWSGAVVVNMTDQYNDAGIAPTSSQADHFGVASVGWLGTSIFFKFEITDDSLDFSGVADGWWNTDSIEILLDLGNLQIAYPVSDVTQSEQFDSNGGPVQLRGLAYDDTSQSLYNLIAFNDMSGLAYNSAAIPVSNAQLSFAHSAFANGLTAEIEIKITSAALTAAGAAGLADIDSFGLVLTYNDSDADGAAAPANGGSAGTGVRDAQILWWGGASNAPSGGVITYNDAQTGAFFATSNGTFAEAGFVGAGEGGLEDRNYVPPTFENQVDIALLQTALQTLAMNTPPAEYLLAILGVDLYGAFGFPADPVIEDTVELYRASLILTASPLIPGQQEFYNAFIHNGQVLYDLGITSVAPSDVIWTLFLTMGEPYKTPVTNLLAALALPGLTPDLFQSAPGFWDDADFDGDSITNADEYIEAGSAAAYIAGQTQALPVAGLIGLGLLAAGCGLGGLVALRKRQ